MTRPSIAVLLVLAAAASVQAGSNPHLVAVDTDHDLFEIDTATGVKTLIGVVSANAGPCADLTVGPANVVYLSTVLTDSLYTLDLPTGGAALVGPYGNSAIHMRGLEYVPATGTLYGVSTHDGGLYVVDQSTGAATLVGLTGLASAVHIAWNPANGTMYATDTATDSLHTIDLATGAAALVGPLNGPLNTSALAFHANGTLYLMDNTNDVLHAVDISSGSATPIGPSGPGQLFGLVYFDGQVPVELTGFAVE